MRRELEGRAAILDGAGRDAAEVGEVDWLEAPRATDRALEPDVEPDRIVPWIDRHDEVRRSSPALEGNG